jgi:type II restriction enzyme
MNVAPRPYFHHLSSSDDLITSYEATRAGFISLALERNIRSTPVIAEARALRVAASQAMTPAQLFDFHDLQPALLTAAGISAKAAGHLLPADKVEAIRGLIENFLEPAGPAFVEELVYRFLLTRGDTLGGAMRNVAGVAAQRTFTRALLAAITLSGRAYSWLDSRTKKWLPGGPDNFGVESSLRALSWSTPQRERTMMYNLTVSIVRNNVDVCVLDCAPQQLNSDVRSSPDRYIALGELKGGIDPAGADEHWKTARTALARIRDSFARAGAQPATFFAGAAIERKMSEEIWEQLQDRSLANAANLTNPDQIASLCSWLVSI